MGTMAAMKMTRIAWGFPNRSFFFYFFLVFSSSPTTDATQREGESEPKKMIEATVNFFFLYIYFICIMGARWRLLILRRGMGMREILLGLYFMLSLFISQYLTAFLSLPWLTTSGEEFR